jgi:hypothetical protein
MQLPKSSFSVVEWTECLYHLRLVTLSFRSLYTITDITTLVSCSVLNVAKYCNSGMANSMDTLLTRDEMVKLSSLCCK